MKRLAITMVLVIMAHGVRAENWAQWFDASCQIAGYLNVEETRRVPLMMDLIDGQDNASRFISTIRDWTSVDLDSVTDAWFGVAGKDDAIFVLEGTFNLSVIRGALGAIERFQVQTPPGAEFAVMMPDDGKPGNVNMAAFLTPSAVAIGQPARVDAFLANREADSAHPRRADLASLADSPHLFECILLEVPNDKGDIPRVILKNIHRLRMTARADEYAHISVAVHPRNPAMTAPLRKVAEGVVEVYGCLPAGQIRLDPIRQALLDNLAVSSSGGAVVLHTVLPLDLVRHPLATRLNPAAVQAEQ